MTYHLRSVASSVFGGSATATAAGSGSGSGAATTSGSASATAPARRMTLFASSLEISGSSGFSSVPRKSRAAAAACSSESLAGSISSGSLVSKSSRSSLMRPPLWARGCWRWRRRSSEDAARDRRGEQVVEQEDVQADQHRDEQDDEREADDRLAARPGHLLQLLPGLLGETGQADASRPSCHSTFLPRHGWRDSNSQPLVLETSALPIELQPCGPPAHTAAERPRGSEEPSGGVRTQPSEPWLGYSLSSGSPCARCAFGNAGRTSPSRDGPGRSSGSSSSRRCATGTSCTRA